MSEVYDYALVGGGLQNGLIALALLRARPEVRIALVERDQQVGGNHTWCFHSGDIPAAARDFVDPLVVHDWPGYSVSFPNLQREVDARYCAVTSERFDAVVGKAVESAPGCRLLTGVSATQVAPNQVTLDDGTRLAAELVVDARGPQATGDEPAGYQKFLGLELELKSPHTLERPWLMDATVPQHDGYRFIYTLPLSPTRVLIEDTYFSDGPELDCEEKVQGILQYAADKGFVVDRELRRESGILPMPWDGSVVPPEPGLLVAGYRGGWFHPGTGYSFPVAVRLADFLAKSSLPCTEALRPLIRELRTQVKYCHRLNSMLFRWFKPEQRWNVFERFYKLPEPLIRRFYSLSMTRGDRARILIGKPPRGMSLRAGISNHFGASA